MSERAEQHAFYVLFLAGYSLAALGELMRACRFAGMSHEYCVYEAEALVRNEVNLRRQHKRRTKARAA